MASVLPRTRRLYRMVKLQKVSLFGGVLLGTTLLSLAVSTYFLQSSDGGQTFDLSRFSPMVSKEKTRGQLQYENAWSEQIELENQVKPFENYIINWVATYTGRKGFQGQNTRSLKFGTLENKGSYTNMTELVKHYPNLLGVIEKVTIEYSYDSVANQLVQRVSVTKRGVEGYRQATVVYDATGSVVDYTLGNFVKVGGSSEEN